MAALILAPRNVTCARSCEPTPPGPLRITFRRTALAHTHTTRKQPVVGGGRGSRVGAKRLVSVDSSISNLIHNSHSSKPLGTVSPPTLIPWLLVLKDGGSTPEKPR